MNINQGRQQVCRAARKCKQAAKNAWADYITYPSQRRQVQRWRGVGQGEKLAIKSGYWMLLFTFALSAVAIGQCRTMSRQVDIAGDQAKISHDQMVADHRPWIFPTGFVEKPAGIKAPEGTHAKYMVTVKNVGTGPAIGLTVQAWTTRYRRKVIEAMHADCDKSWAVPPQVPLAPNEEREFFADDVEPGAETERTRDDTDPDMWAFGRIDYLGGFGEYHATIFCRAMWRLSSGWYYGICGGNCAN
jgi:hypothetical protein